ncbi:agamous-like MADS-box protein AGL80 [Aristolochia californica]|uniref:agamous-like MADS-box protein AGL80 n=1 Tax=Aristolochia californica TaxID=171875 RepID=UPI0035DDF50E
MYLAKTWLLLYILKRRNFKTSCSPIQPNLILPSSSMARKKVALAWIADDVRRKATFMKRKRGLIKKVSEISTLCSVEATVVLDNPYMGEQEVWPSIPDAADTFLKFKSLPESDRCKKMSDQEGFYRQSNAKHEEKLKKLEKENKEIETDILMYQCLGGRNFSDLIIADLDDITKRIDLKAKVVEKRINFLKGYEGEVAPPAMEKESGSSKAK